MLSNTTNLVLPLFVSGGLKESVTPIVWIGVVIAALANLRFGWTLSGLAVPGYLTFLALCSPMVAGLVVVEGIFAYYMFLGTTRVVSRIFDCPEPFGRDRFFGLFLFSIVSRILWDTRFIPFLSVHFEFLRHVDTGTSGQSFGTLVVALLANYFWKPGVVRGLLPILSTTILCYGVTVYGLVPFTNYNINATKLLFVDPHFTIDASTWTYLVLCLTALLASRMNLLFGWEYGGIILPSLVALELWNWVHLVGLALDTACTVLLSGLVLKLPIFRKITIEGARKLLLFFSVSLFSKVIFQWLLVAFGSGILASELSGFGFLLSTLFAIKIHDKKIAIRLTSASLQVALGGYALAIVIANLLLFTPFASIAVEENERSARVASHRLVQRVYSLPGVAVDDLYTSVGLWLSDQFIQQQEGLLRHQQGVAPTLRVRFSDNLSKTKSIEPESANSLVVIACLESGQLWQLNQLIDLAQKVHANYLEIISNGMCSAGLPPSHLLANSNERTLMVRLVPGDQAPLMTLPRSGESALTLESAEQGFPGLVLSWGQSLHANTSILTHSLNSESKESSPFVHARGSDSERQPSLFEYLMSIQSTVALGGYASWSAIDLTVEQQTMLIHEVVRPLFSIVQYPLAKGVLPDYVLTSLRNAQAVASHLGYSVNEVWDRERSTKAWVLHGRVDLPDLVGKGLFVFRRPKADPIMSISSGYSVYGRGMGELAVATGLRESFDVIALDTLPHIKMPTRKTKLKTSLFAAVHEALYRSAYTQGTRIYSTYLRIPPTDSILGIDPTKDEESFSYQQSNNAALVEIVARRFPNVEYINVPVSDEVRRSHRNRFFKQGITTRMETSFIGAEVVDWQDDLLPSDSKPYVVSCDDNDIEFSDALKALSQDGDIVPLENLITKLSSVSLVRLPLTGDVLMLFDRTPTRADNSNVGSPARCIEVITQRKWIVLDGVPLKGVPHDSVDPTISSAADIEGLLMNTDDVRSDSDRPKGVVAP